MILTLVSAVVLYLRGCIALEHFHGFVVNVVLILAVFMMKLSAVICPRRIWASQLGAVGVRIIGILTGALSVHILLSAAVWAM